MIDTKNFTKLTKEQKENIHGGFAWMIVAFFAMQTITQAIASYKMTTSNSGSYKQSGYESHWDNKSSSGSSSKTSSEQKVTNVFYAY